MGISAGPSDIAVTEALLASRDFHFGSGHGCSRFDGLLQHGLAARFRSFFPGHKIDGQETDRWLGERPGIIVQALQQRRFRFRVVVEVERGEE